MLHVENLWGQVLGPVIPLKRGAGARAARLDRRNLGTSIPLDLLFKLPIFKQRANFFFSVREGTYCPLPPFSFRPPSHIYSCPSTLVANNNLLFFISHGFIPSRTVSQICRNAKYEATNMTQTSNPAYHQEDQPVPLKVLFHLAAHPMGHQVQPTITAVTKGVSVTGR